MSSGPFPMTVSRRKVLFSVDSSLLFLTPENGRRRLGSAGGSSGAAPRSPTTPTLQEICRLVSGFSNRR
jgi:hypothetical protein